ncbi:MAG: IPExxxVDY family protein [Chitinophagales bacterium]|nr:IPExxxVDY family protein [Chitinophagales bacterium]
MSRKNLLLDIGYDYDFELISIISSWRDYRLCWLLNKTCGIELMKLEDLKIEYPRKQAAFFHLYHYNDELNWTQYYFIANKSGGEALIPELKQVDYFVQIAGGNASNEKDRILGFLKENRAIEAVFETKPMELKSKQNLIIE